MPVLPVRSRLLSFLRVAVAGPLAIAAAACGNNDTPTTPTTTPAAAAVEVYTGALQPGQLGFYSFQATGTGTASFTFASLTHNATGRTLDAALQIGAGIPAGEGCAVTNAVTTGPGLVAQLNHPVVAGTYCVQVLDPGNLSAAVTFAVRIRRP